MVKKVLAIDGYLYRINYHNNENNKIYWKCKTNGCRTSAITENEQLKNSRDEHNHGPDGNEISKKLFIEKAKKAINKEPLKTIPCVNTNKDSESMLILSYLGLSRAKN